MIILPFSTLRPTKFPNKIKILLLNKGGILLGTTQMILPNNISLRNILQADLDRRGLPLPLLQNLKFLLPNNQLSLNKFHIIYLFQEVDFGHVQFDGKVCFLEEFGLGVLLLYEQGQQFLLLPDVEVLDLEVVFQGQG